MNVKLTPVVPTPFSRSDVAVVSLQSDALHSHHQPSSLLEEWVTTLAP